MSQDNTPQALSEEQLANVRRLAEQAYARVQDQHPGTDLMAFYWLAFSPWEDSAPSFMLYLLAEVERLKAARKDAMRETWQWVSRAENVATELDEMASALDIDMPSDNGYVERVQAMARKLRAESEGSADE